MCIFFLPFFFIINSSGTCFHFSTLLPLLVHLYLTPGKQASTFHSIDSSNECVDRRAKNLRNL